MIFISYSREDQKKVKQLKADIESLGYLVFFDTYNNVAGDDWWKKIIENIEKSDILLYCLSKSSKNSIYCQQEYQYALKCNITVIPCVLDRSFVVKEDLPVDLKDFHTMDFYDRNIDNIIKLSKTLKTKEFEAKSKEKNIVDEKPSKPKLLDEKISDKIDITKDDEDGRERFDSIIKDINSHYLNNILDKDKAIQLLNKIENKTESKSVSKQIEKLIQDIEKNSTPSVINRVYTKIKNTTSSKLR